MRRVLILSMAVVSMTAVACSGAHKRASAQSPTSTASPNSTSVSGSSSIPETTSTLATSSSSVSTLYSGGLSVPSSLITQGDQICQAAQQQIRGLNQSDFPSYLRQGLTALQTERTKLAALSIPTVDRAVFSSFLGELDLTIAQVQQAIAKLPDQAAARTAFSGAAKPAQGARDAASALGFTICGNPRPTQIPIVRGTATTR